MDPNPINPAIRSPQPATHHRMAFGFRFDAAAAAFRPATKRLTVFERGRDDARPEVTDPWLGAGYLVPQVPPGEREAATLEVTNAYRNGSLVPHPLCGIILGVRVAPPPTLRLAPAASVRGTDETPAFPRAGGSVDAELARFTSIFWRAFLLGAYGELLAPATGHGVATFPAYYDRWRRVGWRPADRLIISAEESADRPNRMRFTFPGAPDRVTLPRGVTAPGDGDFVVLDVDVRVTVAMLARQGERLLPFTDADADKVAAWEKAAAEGRLA